jgi:hypothetical protein
MVANLVFQIVGLRDFGKQYSLRIRWHHYARLVVGAFPYALVRGGGAARGLARIHRKTQRGADLARRGAPEQHAGRGQGRCGVTTTVETPSPVTTPALPAVPEERPKARAKRTDLYLAGGLAEVVLAFLARNITGFPSATGRDGAAEVLRPQVGEPSAGTKPSCGSRPAGRHLVSRWLPCPFPEPDVGRHPPTITVVSTVRPATAYQPTTA